MKKATVLAAATLASLLVLPASAGAAPVAAQGVEPSWLPVALSLIGLLVAVFLLIEVWQLRRISLGGAIGENIRYVILATICLAGASLADWILNFVTVGFTAGQIEFARMLLVVAAMALLAVYFLMVRRVFTGYLKAMTEMEQVAASEASEPSPVEPSAEKDEARV